MIPYIHGSPHASAAAALLHGTLRPGRVNNPAVLAAVAAVNRANFVPPHAAAMAYTDAALVLIPGREMLPPLVQVHLLQGVNLMPGANVLVLAAGTGYLAAVAAELVGPTGQVVAVEDAPELFNHAHTALAAYPNVQVVAGNPALGHAAGAPYDAIIIDTVAAQLPATLTAQLAPGGRLAMVLAGPDGLPEVTVFAPSPAGLTPTTLFETAGPVHAAFAKPAGFVF
jgi:protein-L-isoaspartate(D-aspartate) O-methyltransferase